jgi:hypothetical protein
MGYDDETSRCPHDKSNQYEDEKHLFLGERAFEEIDDDNSNTIKCMEKDYAPQPDFQIFKQRRTQ